MIALAVIDFPLPDSPTIPTVSPGATDRSMFDTIVFSRPPSPLWMRRSRTSSSGSTATGACATPTRSTALIGTAPATP